MMDLSRKECELGFDVAAYYPDAGSAVATKDEIEAAFAEAKEWRQKKGGGYDGFIGLGSLDCGQSIMFLERAIGRTFEPTKAEIWLAEEVRQLFEAAVWPDPASVGEEERWAYWSARKFLEVCVKHGLGIWTV